MPFFALVFLLGILLFDVVQLLALDLVLVLGFFVGANDSGSKRLEDVRGVGCGGHCQGRGCNVGHDVNEVEGGTVVHEFPIIRVNGETSLLELSLVDAHAPQDKKINVDLIIPSIKIHVVVMKGDVLLASVPVREDKGKGGGGILGEDGIAEEGGRKEYLDGFQIGHAIIHSGSGEGLELICRETGIDVGIGWDNCLEGE
jgi:hypothetical protein